MWIKRIFVDVYAPMFTGGIYNVALCDNSFCLFEEDENICHSRLVSKQTVPLFAIEITTDQERRLKELMKVFLEENQKINLSAYRSKEQCWIGNILDSVAGGDVFRAVGARDYAPLQHNVTRILDVGTGGGFPLLPLAILFPDVEFTGLDATRKKIDAVQRIIDTLKITNVRLLLGRAEELGHDGLLREQYDYVLSRALAPLSVLLEYMSPFARIGGILICWKSMAIECEIAESKRTIAQLQISPMESIGYELQDDWGKRQLLLFKKKAVLSDEFPRGVGIPKKEPL